MIYLLIATALSLAGAFIIYILVSSKERRELYRLIAAKDAADFRILNDATANREPAASKIALARKRWHHKA